MQHEVQSSNVLTSHSGQARPTLLAYSRFFRIPYSQAANSAEFNPQRRHQKAHTFSAALSPKPGMWMMGMTCAHALQPSFIAGSEHTMIPASP